MDELTRRRMEANEKLFRSVNEEIDDRSERAGDVEYVCECADTSCAETIRLTHAEYSGVRSDPDQYVVLPGHVKPDVEDVVERHEGWVVVRKG